MQWELWELAWKQRLFAFEMMRLMQLLQLSVHGQLTFWADSFSQQGMHQESQ
jgi:hypothetical protein